MARPSERLHPRASHSTLANGAFSFACAVAAGCGSATMPETMLPIVSAPEPTSSEYVEVRAIVVAWAGAERASPVIARTPEDAAERARTLAGLVRQGGARFGALQREYSDAGPDPLRFGLRDESVPTQLRELASSIAVGAIGGPVRTEQGYFIIERQPDPAGP